MNRISAALIASLAFLIMIQGCNRKVGSTAVINDGAAMSSTTAPAVPPATQSPRDLMEAIPPVSNPSQVPMQTAMGVPKKAMQFQDVFFDYDKALLRQEIRSKLEADAKMLKEHPEMKTTIEGHCDERGSGEYNLVLGNRRAEAVKRYLINLGVEPSQLSTISYGKEKPFCSEHNEACYQENRRAHFVGSGEAN